MSFTAFVSQCSPSKDLTRRPDPTQSAQRTIRNPTSDIRNPSPESDIIQVMTRRELLVGTLGAASLPAKTKNDRSRISAISDEIGKSPQASIDFAKQYDLQFLELRNVPGGKEYSFLPEDEVKQAAADFARNGIRISFMNSSLLKFPWPGTEGVRKRKETDAARTSLLEAEATRFKHRL